MRGGAIHVATVALISLCSECASVCWHARQPACTRSTVISLLASPVHLSAAIQSDLQLHRPHQDILHTHSLHTHMHSGQKEVEKKKKHKYTL